MKRAMCCVAAAFLATAPARADEVQELLLRAQESYVHGVYDDALTYARKAITVEPGSPKAWKIIGASSCFLKDRKGAEEAMGKLDSNQDRQFVTYVCTRNGIDLGGGGKRRRPKASGH